MFSKFNTYLKTIFYGHTDINYYYITELSLAKDALNLAKIQELSITSLQEDNQHLQNKLISRINRLEQHRTQPSDDAHSARSSPATPIHAR